MAFYITFVQACRFFGKLPHWYQTVHNTHFFRFLSAQNYLCAQSTSLTKPDHYYESQNFSFWHNRDLYRYSIQPGFQDIILTHRMKVSINIHHHSVLILINKTVQKNHYDMFIETANGFFKSFSQCSVITSWVFCNESP